MGRNIAEEGEGTFRRAREREHITSVREKRKT